MTLKAPALPAVSGTLAVTTSLIDAVTLGLPTALPGLLSAALSQKTTDLDVLYDYAHDNQIGKNGQYWKGRKPADGNLQDALPQLVQDDQIGPAQEREVDAQFAKDPEWEVQEAGQTLENAELVTALTDWHREAGLTAILKDAARARWWAARMVGRVYIPEDYAEQLQRTPKTLAAILELIHVEPVDPRYGGPLLDAHKRVLGYWNRYGQIVNGEKVIIVELYTPDRFLVFQQGVDGHLTHLPERDADSPFKGAGTARRAEYLMWHADRDGGSSITRSVRDAQDRLNVVGTYMGRNDEQTGYRQFIVSNAEGPVDREGKPAAYQMGPGVVVNLKGLTIDAVKTTAGERPQRHTPTWQIVDPLNPEEFHIPSINQWKRSLLEKLDQLWTLTPETNVSGESKRQSRKPFDKRVTFGSQDTGGFLAWALRAALMLAAQVMEKTSEYQNVTFLPKLYLDVDAVNLEELRVKLAMWQAGALKLTTLLEATPGVADAAAEAKDLDEGGGSPESQAQQAALNRLVNPDAGNTG
ncbi:hypothetical protein E7T06_07240 [Deinococcus sp. Arct2-2]|uniref:hypothetical protein n=1 Tax=Deinococcus sp. Arct2-2 TaxID=2568653 RepID=UPI0010A56948|nr:hypothetical protein [Deinococcus sp. Arct2-2]THF70491.1 hypothetical protein E7T06_07240 [Deinococcus sp. Arct2-2]